MQRRVFIINDRFAVDCDRNEIKDKMTGQVNRLEPRLMKLLCLLADQAGKVVKRDLIIKEIWNDYPGANEGLNQAISFLRKLLDDENKEIIQTLPKSGYNLSAVISQSSDNKPRSKKMLQIAIVVSVFLLVLLLIADILFRKNTSEKQGNERRDAEIGRLDSAHQAKQMQQYSKDTMGKAAKGDSIR